MFHWTFQLYFLATLFFASFIIILNADVITPPSKRTTEIFDNSELALGSVPPSPKDLYYEDLFIKPLVDGKLFAEFQFKTLYRKDVKSLRWENKIQIFPLSLADLFLTTDLNELHFSLTKGNWNYRNWGYSTRPSPPGAQIRAKFSHHNKDSDRSWTRLINSLSGKFCASLTTADKKILVYSKLAFETQSAITHNSSAKTLYANLPEETLCTENLTPWKKLLPCHSNSGLASLLNAVNLLKSSFSSLAIDLQPQTCQNNGQLKVDCEQVQLIQTISVVFNPLHLFEGKQTWSLAKIFGNSIQRTCPLASHSRVYVDVSRVEDKNNIYPKTYHEQKLNIKFGGQISETRTYAVFDVNSILGVSKSKSDVQFNVGIKQNQIFKQPPATSRLGVPVHLRTHVAGSGTNEGTIVATVTNQLATPTRITYMDVVPHYLRVYLHTLTIRTKIGQELKPDRLNFVLSKDTAPTLIEFSIIIPPNSETHISYDFERAFLACEDYRPDANKGVLLGSAQIGVLSQQSMNRVVFPTKSLHSNLTTFDSNLDDERDVSRIYSRPLLIILPTPDFSMPYNVLCFVSSVLVAGFLQIFNFTTERLRCSVKKQNAATKDSVDEKETLGENGTKTSKKED